MTQRPDHTALHDEPHEAPPPTLGERLQRGSFDVTAALVLTLLAAAILIAHLAS